MHSIANSSKHYSSQTQLTRTRSPLRGSKNFNQTGHSRMSTMSPSILSASKNAAKTQIDELLRCIICLVRASNPQMCPHCSNLFCYSCIRRWLTEQKSSCPHCLRPLRVTQLVNCKLMSDLGLAIDDMSIKKKEEKKDLDACATHNLEFYYYCKDCEEALCTDCAMFGKKHKGHEFQHISKVYESQVELIKAEAKQLKGRINTIVGKLSSVDQNIQQITESKETKANELGLILEQMAQRLEAEFKSKLLDLLAQKSSITEEIDILQTLENELEKDIAHPIKSKLFVRSKEWTRKLRKIAAELPPVNPSRSINFTSEVVPTYTPGSFIIKNFSKTRQSEQVIYSEPLTEFGLSWRLKVYPNGSGQAKGIYISVFLEMIKGMDETKPFEYRVEMINQRDNNIVYKRESTSEFETGECWGYNKFFRLDMLEADGYLNSQKDMLVFRYYVRSPTYCHQSQDLQRHIHLLEEEQNNFSSTINELKRKIKEEKEKTEMFKGSQGSGSLKEELHLHHFEGDVYEQESKNSHIQMIQSDNEEEEEEEHKEEDGLHEEKSVSTEYEDVDSQEEEEEEEEGYTTRRKHEDLVSNLQDYKRDIEMEKSHEMPSSIGGKEEDSKYDDLFDKEDWLDTEKVNVYCREIDEFLRGKTENREEHAVEQSSEEDLDLKVPIDTLNLKEEIKRDSMKRGIEVSQSKAENGDVLQAINIDQMFNEKTDDSQRSREKGQMNNNKRRIPRDTAFLQLSDSVTKRLSSLKASDSFRNTNSGTSSLRDTVELEKSNLAGNRSKGALLDIMDKENIPELNMSDYDDGRSN